MRATIMYKAGDVRVENVPDAKLVEPTDAVIRITRACICGSDLWPYKELEAVPGGRPMGHEAIGVVETVGTDVNRIKRGDLVVMPFAYSDGTCAFCHEGLQTACSHGGFFGVGAVGGAQFAPRVEQRALSFAGRSLGRRWQSGYRWPDIICPKSGGGQ